MVDISPHGAHLEIGSALNPNCECRISLPLLDGIVRVKARVVYCKLTGFSTKDSGGGLVYHAGLEFLDVDPRLSASISLTYPPLLKKSARQGPIKVKVNVGALEHAAELGKHGAN